MLVHVLDCATEEPGRDPITDLDVIEAELIAYDQLTEAGLAERPRVVLLNKIDVPEARDLAEIVTPDLQARGLDVYQVSAASGEGLRGLAFALAAIVAQARHAAPEALPTRLVIRPEPVAGPDFTCGSARMPSGSGAPSRAGGSSSDFSNDEAVGYPWTGSAGSA